MKILLSWLREFVPLTVQPRQIAHDLTMLGLAVDALTHEQDETIFDLDITTNRPDCLNHYGVARELAAFYGLPLKPLLSSDASQPEKPRARGRRRDGIVEIEATDLCLRYSARLVRGVEVKPSPEWLQRRLALAGVRAINNIADATNYILMACGHPLHAFDLDRLQGGRIIVRNARDKETLRTLDGIERELRPADLVIADARHAVALAGIMGGEASGISPATRNVLIEAAWFDPATVRRTAKAQGLRTEASLRFERGADLEATLTAASLCAELIQQLAGGVLDPVALDAGPKPPARPAVLLRRWEIERHLGLDVPPADVQQILSRLGFLPREKGRMGWTCSIPSHRLDVTREIDLVEEVARHFGYDKVPLRLPPSSGQATHRTAHARQENRVVERMLELGYDETISPVMVRRETESYGGGSVIALANPLSEESAVLRTSLVPGLLAAIEWNLNRGQSSVRFFEVGKTYESRGDGYREPAVLGIAATGARAADQVGAAGRAMDFYDLKGDIEQVCELFSLQRLEVDDRDLPAYYRPGHAARFSAAGQFIACCGQLAPAVAEQWKFRQDVYLAEVSLDALYAHPLRPPQVKQISRFPAVERDFSLLLPEGTLFETVRQTVETAGIAGLEAVRAVETFRGGSLAPGSYSLLLRVTLQSAEATLTEADLAERSAKIIQALESQLGARIRAAS